MKHLYAINCWLFAMCYCMLLVLPTQWLNAEELFFENFDDCSLPSGWTSELTGNQNAVWGIGIPDNPEIEGLGGESSIDGSCFLFFDDYATGGSTWNATVTSPSIAVSSGGIVTLEADIHFRTWGNNGWIKLWVFDGTQFQEVLLIQENQYIGTTYDRYRRVTVDISAYANPNLQVRLEYDDGGAGIFWGGIDNVAINRNILIENFDNCTLPTNWTIDKATGDFDWHFGEDSIWTYSMNGSCMAFFNDDKVGELATPSRVSLTSPTFNGTQNASIFLEVDAHILNYGNSSLGIGLLIDGSLTMIHDVLGTPGEWYPYNVFDELRLDISAYRNPSMQVVFIYDDGASWAWRAAIDNFKIIGYGETIDNCGDAMAVTLDAPCLAATNANTLLTGPVPTCSDNADHSAWFSFVAPASEAVTIMTHASFNDIISVFEGNCGSLTEISCVNRDEFGFTGETLGLSNLIADNTYFIRISGVVDTFGSPAGDFCIQVFNDAVTIAQPPNDDCANAITLNMDANCTNGTNTNASLENNELLSSLDNRARASVWYNFTAPSTGNVLVKTNADFADVLTVFEGNCAAFTEVATNDYGHTLLLRDLVPAQTYWLQVTGYFATVEGAFCVEIVTPPNTPTNDLCDAALTLSLDGTCQNYGNLNATMNSDLTDLEVPFNVHAGNTISANTFVRPNAGATCNLNGGNYSVGYDVLYFTVSTNGNYSITNTYDNFDGYMHLYENAFDAANPCSNYVSGNDDYNSELSSQLIENLVAGTNYYLVTSSFGFWEGGNYSSQVAAVSGSGMPLLLVADANLSSVPTSCDIQSDAAIWFKFTAPASGGVQINTGADFIHAMAIFSGGCGALQEVACSNNPSKCDDYVIVDNLVAGNDYFVQIVSAQSPFGYNYGNVCIDMRPYTSRPIKVRARMLLQSAYIGNGRMNTALNDNQLLPQEQPYQGAPWNYSGRECIEEVPSAMVDWVLLELRDANDLNTIVQQKAAILLSNGNIVDEGEDGVFFNNLTENESYYMLIRHRNHVDVMSAVPVPIPNANHYLFTGGEAYILGGSEQVADSGDGYSLLHAGDVNGDGIITVMDFNQYASESGSINQYISSDCNLDGSTTISDYNFYRANASVIGINPVRL